MANEIGMFDSAHYNKVGQSWTKADTALITAMSSVPLFFAVYLLSIMLPALIWVFWPVAALAVGQGMRKGIQSHKYYGLTENQKLTVQAIEGLPPEVRVRYGEDYVGHVRQIGDGRASKDLHMEVQRLAEQQRITEENRKDHEVAPLVEALKETTREIKQDLKLLDPGPLQLTSGPSKSDRFERASRRSAPGWEPEDDYDYKYR
jgi:hypothetical protein